MGMKTTVEDEVVLFPYQTCSIFFSSLDRVCSDPDSEELISACTTGAQGHSVNRDLYQRLESGAQVFGVMFRT